MPPKRKIAPPIDRPLSKAYLRGFTGWSTAYPPGASEPTSLRLMENLTVDRNGALQIRPGLKYLSWKTPPDLDPVTPGAPGTAYDLPLVGTQEPFYTVSGNKETGEKALLFAVRELDNTVGFRALLFSGTAAKVHLLTDPEIGFDFPQGVETMNFTEKTTYVKYLQLDNKIIAMSDKGEPIRIFFVGEKKYGKRPNLISVPNWANSHKLSIVHPDAAWILGRGVTTRRNQVKNPSFEIGGYDWDISDHGEWYQSSIEFSGEKSIAIRSIPERENLATSPLHNVASLGTTGWASSVLGSGTPNVTVDGTYMKISESAKGLFFAYSAKYTGVDGGKRYRVAVDQLLGSGVQPKVYVMFYNASSSQLGDYVDIDLKKENGRAVTPAITAPSAAVAMRVWLGGENSKAGWTYMKYKNLVVCKDGESTNMFHGGSGTNFFWEGTANESRSTFWPPHDVRISCDPAPIRASVPYNASIYVSSQVAKSVSLQSRTYDKDAKLVNTITKAGTTTAGGAWVRVDVGTASNASTAVKADIYLLFSAVARGQTVYADAAMIEYGPSVVQPYFDGGVTSTATVKNAWVNQNDAPRTISEQTTKANPDDIPLAEIPTTKTLIASGGYTANKYKMGFFYTFENEIGESAASPIVEVRISRPWSDWLWYKPDAATGDPDSAVPTAIPEDCADQLVAILPQTVYDQAISEGATRWNLYAFAWSDQDPVPVVAQLAASRELYPDASSSLRVAAESYPDGGWLGVTPARRAGINEAVLPTKLNRENYARPPRTRNGLVAGDRMILVGDSDNLAVIRWTSNRPGEYTNFTAARGGGAKTLTTGNLHVPADVQLWQNPQSVDTLTILCTGLDGESISYYMMPASVTAQSGSTSVMGFEETTSTPGTLAPYGNEVLNNALYRPLDRFLLKSTAANYNISHKPASDKIANLWWRLRSKEGIMSAQLDNRLFYLVHNPFGELLEDGCRGNELWIYDITGETGIWSRNLVQGSSIRVLSIGDRDYLSITRPDGLYYFDPEARLDDYVYRTTDPEEIAHDYEIRARQINWMFETNTQGANKAHDAWAHLQQIQVTLGNFIGTLQYGIRALDVNSQRLEFVKEMTDLHPITGLHESWDVNDVLQIRRDLKEWHLFARSVEGKPSSGLFSYVQYRYTPVTVNVGYEYGTIESFDYGENLQNGPNIYSDNGIPQPVPDYSRP